MKKVKFLKSCRWAFSLTKRLSRPIDFKEGDIELVEDVEAQSMIDNGYAVEFSPAQFDIFPEESKKPEIIKTTYQADQDDEAADAQADRFRLYKERFSLDELKDFCKENDIPIKTNRHRTIPAIIEFILEHEKEHGEFNIEE